MNHLDRLKAVIAVAQQEDDLPDYLAERILAIVEVLQGSEVLRDEVDELTNQVAQYDTFGQTGYIGMGVDNNILEGSIKRLEGKLGKRGEK